MTAFISLTRKELMRKRVFVATLLLGMLFLGLYGFGVQRMFQWLHRNSAEIVEQYMNSLILLHLGLFFGQFAVAFFVIFSTMGTLSGERESGLLLAVLARPLPRWKLYMGKWIGHAVWILLFSAAIFWAIVGIVHAFGRYPLDPGILLRAFALFEWIPLLLLSLSMLGSVYLPTLGNGIASALLFATALFCGMLEGIMKTSGHFAAVEKFNLLVSLLVPSDSVFRRMTYELIDGSHIPWISSASLNLGPFTSPGVPSDAFLLYTAVYLAALLFLGCRAFTKKDI